MLVFVDIILLIIAEIFFGDIVVIFGNNKFISNFIRMNISMNCSRYISSVIILDIV